MRLKRYVLFLVSFALLAAAVATGIRSQSNVLRPPVRQDADTEINAPEVNFNAPEASDPKEKALRRERGKRYDYPGGGADVQRFVLSDKSPEVALDLPVSHGPTQSPLPARESDAVVVGKVTDARAYLSNDKTSVYSEFTLLLDDVLKQSPSAPLAPGTVISAERRGGVVRLPSGKSLVRGEFGRTMPRAGHRYVLFLRWHDEGQVFSILTGYELRGGKVVPLDGLSEKAPHLKQFAAFKDADESSFLNKIREALSTPPEGGLR
ncbi:MAG TPA: hypothetical protein VN282_27710 [Pyrinomonadaceae bacterium]|nr:hypothetical protein [Pyrinomonadaceae bacterium]